MTAKACRREAANSAVPAPISQKNPGAQRCVTHRVTNAAVDAYA
jgi:hypothetical protein